MIDIYETISRLQKEKGDVIPSHVLMEDILKDVQKQVKKDINTLCKDKKIAFHRTVNSVAFDIIE